MTQQRDSQTSQSPTQSQQQQNQGQNQPRRQPDATVPPMRQQEQDSRLGTQADRGTEPTRQHSGAHAKDADERIESRSADPGQSSYGGFRNEDPSRQAQDTDKPGSRGK
ncbi:hypothetical protein FOZ76_06110 [Verticiella sediminum]|uniref:Uncharacterized protein n=1 Tax=Verticiella sediminum TaxID=1247510 RepID=A0A556AWH7_9BURK|nr:hypothetical protein [Verticiella sediminum]TSH97301.1 hypothetical protein FOZ76_06110 [Verticiella sediminum]